MSPVRNFCTFFDYGYLPRALVMIQSLYKFAPQIKLWLLCMDDECYDELARRKIPYISLIRLSEFERGDDALLAAKQNRSRIEYYFTCTPSLPLFILKNNPDIPSITYLDADMSFYSSPEPVFDEIEIHDASIAITPHHFAKNALLHETNGKYNVGWLTFRNDHSGLACLNWWRERCNEWCHDFYDGARFGDQKYLDHFHDLFQGVYDIQHKGVNLAVWNVGGYKLSKIASNLFVDNQPLVCYHFHGLKQIRTWLYSTEFGNFQLVPDQILRDSIYKPYIRTIQENGKSLNIPKGIRKRKNVRRGWLLDLIIDLLKAIRDFFSGRFIFS